MEFDHQMGFLDTRKDIIWDNPSLLDLYQELVDKMLKQPWAVTEIESGESKERLENLLWSDFEDWALNYLEEEKNQ